MVEYPLFWNTKSNIYLLDDGGGIPKGVTNLLLTFFKALASIIFYCLLGIPQIKYVLLHVFVRKIQPTAGARRNAELQKQNKQNRRLRTLRLESASPQNLIN